MTLPPLRIAIIGAGVFARDVHLPTLLSMPDRFEVAAVCSRSHESAEHLASAAHLPVEVTTDLDALLARDDIDVVDIIVPINVLPDITERALDSGKHVISEKPVAPTVARGKALLAHQRPDRVWMVAENMRYVQSFLAAADILKSGQLGQPIIASWTVRNAMAPGNKYYNTEWRRAGDFPGGFLLDGGVHNMAALRLLMGEAEEVAAFTKLVRADMPPLDTVSSTIQFESGALGTFGLTFSAASPSDSGLTVVCENGMIRVRNDQLEVTQSGQTDRSFFSERGVYEEFMALSEAIRNGVPHRNTAQEALRDVALLEAMFRSGEAGQIVRPELVP
jgi:predicted dehydrogenase